jgi:hypothetical protein
MLWDALRAEGLDEESHQDRHPRTPTPRKQPGPNEPEKTPVDLSADPALDAAAEVLSTYPWGTLTPTRTATVPQDSTAGSASQDPNKQQVMGPGVPASVDPAKRPGVPSVPASGSNPTKEPALIGPPLAGGTQPPEPLIQAVSPAALGFVGPAPLDAAGATTPKGTASEEFAREVEAALAGVPSVQSVPALSCCVPAAVPALSASVATTHLDAKAVGDELKLARLMATIGGASEAAVGVVSGVPEDSQAVAVGSGVPESQAVAAVPVALEDSQVPCDSQPWDSQVPWESSAFPDTLPDSQAPWASEAPGGWGHASCGCIACQCVAVLCLGRVRLLGCMHLPNAQCQQARQARC